MPEGFSSGRKPHETLVYRSNSGLTIERWISLLVFSSVLLLAIFVPKLRWVFYYSADVNPLLEGSINIYLKIASINPNYYYSNCMYMKPMAFRAAPVCHLLNLSNRKIWGEFEVDSSNF